MSLLPLSLCCISTWLMTPQQHVIAQASAEPGMQPLDRSTQHPNPIKANPLFQQGTQQLLSNQLLTARQTFEQVLQLHQTQTDTAGEAAVLTQLGEIYTYLHQFDRAQAALQQALERWRKLGDQTGEAAVLIRLGELDNEQGQSAQAVKRWQQALVLHQQGGNALGMAEAWLDLGAISLNQGQFAEGLKQLQQGIATLQAAQNLPESKRRLNQGRLLTWVGQAQFNLKQPELAQQSWQQALALNRETGDRRFEGFALFFIGNAHSSQKQFQPALAAYQQALAIFQPSGDQATVGTLHRAIAATYTYLQQFPAAITAYQQALATYRELGDRQHEALVWLSLGNTYGEQKQYPGAIAAYQQTIAIAKALPDLILEQRALSRLGQRYRDQGFALEDAGSSAEAITAYQQALEAYQQARVLARQIQNAQAEGWATLAMGITQVAEGQSYFSMAAYSQALTAFQQAVDPLQQAQTLGQTLHLASLEGLAIAQRILADRSQGDALAGLNQPEKALQAEQQALVFLRAHRDRLKPQQAQDTEAKILGQIGAYYNSLGQAAEAIQPYQAALALRHSLGDDVQQEVTLLNGLATAYKTLSQYPQALETAQQAVAVQQQLQDPHWEGLLRIQVGNLLQAMGRFAAAIQNQEQVLTKAQRTGDRLLEELALNNLGTVYTEQGDHKRALAYRQQALALTEAALQRLQAGDPTAVEFCFLDAQTQPGNQSGTQPGKPPSGSSRRTQDLCLAAVRSAKVSGLNNLGSSYAALGRLTEALTLQQQALDIAKSLGDRDRTASILNNLGSAYFKLGAYGKALNYFQQALSQVVALGDRAHQSQVLNSIGLVYMDQGQYAKALEYYQQALGIAQQIHSPQTEASILNNLGGLNAYLGEERQALAYFQQSLQRSQALGVNPTVELGNLGISYESQGNLAKARAAYQQALTLAQDNDDRQNQAAVLNRLANLDWSGGHYAQSLQKRQQALAINQETGDRPNQVIALRQLGETYRILGQPDRALESLQQALTLSREMGIQRQEALILNQIGLVYQEQRQYDKALKHQHQALTRQQQLQERLTASQTLVSIGTIQVQQGQFPTAIAALQQALAMQTAVGVRPEQGKTLRELALAYAGQGDMPTAIATLQQALSLHRAVEDRAQEGITLSALGALWLRQNQPQAAATALTNAATILDASRAGLSDRDTVSLFDTQTNTYRLLQQALVAQAKPEAALEAAERGRARAFVELLAQRVKSDADTGAEQTANTAVPPSSSQSLTLAQIQQIGQAEHATLVEYSVIDPQTLYIWVVQPTGQVGFRSVSLSSVLGNAKTSLADFVKLVRLSAIGVRGLGITADTTPSPQPSNSLQTLYRVLIEPIADLLPRDSNQHVVFLPQGPLFLVPFAALQDGAGRSLIEKHTILTAPSIQVLALTHQQAQAHAHGISSNQKQSGSEEVLSETLIVGNPTMPKLVLAPGLPPQPLPALPGSAREAKAIAQFFHTSFLTGNQATKARVVRQMETARLVHLATHGLLDEQNGIHSAIALAPAGQSDGLLTADEILNLKLQAELVVLSACDTGRGKITGDGVIGLSRSFMSAGVSSVIVSLWSVPDVPTAELMTTFYRQLQITQDKAQALRQAMLITKRQYPNPSAWAAFTLMGEATMRSGLNLQPGLVK